MDFNKSSKTNTKKRVQGTWDSIRRTSKKLRPTRRSLEEKIDRKNRRKSFPDRKISSPSTTKTHLSQGCDNPAFIGDYQ